MLRGLCTCRIPGATSVAHAFIANGDTRIAQTCALWQQGAIALRARNAMPVSKGANNSGSPTSEPAAEAARSYAWRISLMHAGAESGSSALSSICHHSRICLLNHGSAINSSVLGCFGSASIPSACSSPRCTRAARQGSTYILTKTVRESDTHADTHDSRGQSRMQARAGMLAGGLSTLGVCVTGTHTR